MPVRSHTYYGHEFQTSATPIPAPKVQSPEVENRVAIPQKKVTQSSLFPLRNNSHATTATNLEVRVDPERLYRKNTYVSVDPYRASVALSLISEVEMKTPTIDDIHVSPPSHTVTDSDVPVKEQEKRPSQISSQHSLQDALSPSFMSAFFLDTLPRIIYSHLLLRLPSLYHSRVARVFKEAEMTMEEIKEMALEIADQDMLKKATRSLTKTWEANHTQITPAYSELKETWEMFISSLMREWKTLNLVSVLLLSAILTILQIQSASDDPVIRYTALLSLVCALMSLLYGCVYIMRFGNMKRTHKAAEWAIEGQNMKTSIVWNVWVMLAMPATWLAWSILLYITSIIAFVWRTGSTNDINIIPLSPRDALVPRIIISAIFSLGLVYFFLITVTFRRYGEAMDEAWKKRVYEWAQAKAATRPMLSRIESIGTPFLTSRNATRGFATIIAESRVDPHPLPDMYIPPIPERFNTEPNTNTGPPPPSSLIPLNSEFTNLPPEFVPQALHLDSNTDEIYALFDPATYRDPAYMDADDTSLDIIIEPPSSPSSSRSGSIDFDLEEPEWNRAPIFIASPTDFTPPSPISLPFRTTKVVDLRYLSVTGHKIPQSLLERGMSYEIWNQFVNNASVTWNIQCQLSENPARYSTQIQVQKPQDTEAMLVDWWNSHYFLGHNTQAVLCQEYLKDLPASPSFSIYLIDHTSENGRVPSVVERFGSIPEGLERIVVFDPLNLDDRDLDHLERPLSDGRVRFGGSETMMYDSPKNMSDFDDRSTHPGKNERPRDLPDDSRWQSVREALRRVFVTSPGTS